VKKSISILFLVSTLSASASEPKIETKITNPRTNKLSTFSSNIESQPQAHTVIQLNVPVSPDLSAHPNMNTNQKSNQSASQSVSQSTSVSIKNEIALRLQNILENTTLAKLKTGVSDAFSATATDLKRRTGTIINDTRYLIVNHKWKIGFATLAALYGFLLLEIWRGRKQNGKWCSWKKDVPFADLLAVPQKELAQQLIDDIKTVYLNAANATNQLTPLIEFLKAIEQELKSLQRSLRVHTFIETTRIEKIFPIKPSSQIMKEKIQRLTYLKNLFSTWLSDYKLQQKKRAQEPVIIECDNPYELCETLVQRGQKVHKKIYNPADGHAIENPYKMALVLMQEHPELVKKKSFLATGMLLAKGGLFAAKGGVFVTKNAFQLMKFLLVWGYKIQKKFNTVQKSSFYQSTKDFLVNLF